MPPNESNNFVVALNRTPDINDRGDMQDFVVISPKRSYWSFLFLMIFLMTVGYTARVQFTAPSDFALNTQVEIPEGFGLNQIAELLSDEHVVRSQLILEVVTRWNGDEKSIPAGVYLFKEPVGVFQVAERLTSGTHGVERVRMTVPEGSSNAQIAELFVKTMPNFDKSVFTELTTGKEGFLFPDTYFFFSNATTGSIVLALVENFVKKTIKQKEEANVQKKKWHEVITMASLIEEEGVTPADRRIISGILWRRISINMPLQVDAPFSYLKGKATTNISLDDLEIDSPYNTYKNRGLPPTPIANPGIDSIDSALNPTITDFFYFLSDKEGKMHYGKTFEEHKTNKAKYLR